MEDLTILLLGGLLGPLLAPRRTQTMVIPPVVTPAAEEREGGYLSPLALLLLIFLGILLFG